MKKKIKDLCGNEINKICENYDINSCHKCPLYISGDEYCKSYYLDKYGDEEIEVDLDEEKD